MGEFDRMISSTDETEPVVDEQLQITDEEYIRWERRWLPLNPLLHFRSDSCLEGPDRAI